MGKSIKVKKGNEVLEIQDTDLQAAVNDGYFPTERVVVANSKTKETFEIDPQDLPSAFKDGFSFQDVSKKKASTDLSMVGGKATPSGGQVGSSKAPSVSKNDYDAAAKRHKELEEKGLKNGYTLIDLSLIHI